MEKSSIYNRVILALKKEQSALIQLYHIEISEIQKAINRHNDPYIKQTLLTEIDLVTDDYEEKLAKITKAINIEIEHGLNNIHSPTDEPQNTKRTTAQSHIINTVDEQLKYSIGDKIKSVRFKSFTEQLRIDIQDILLKNKIPLRNQDIKRLLISSYPLRYNDETINFSGQISNTLHQLHIDEVIKKTSSALTGSKSTRWGLSKQEGSRVEVE